MSTGKSEEIPEDESFESLKKKLQEREALVKIILDKKRQLSEKIASFDSTVSKSVAALEGQLNLLRSYQKKSSEVKSRIADENCLNLTGLENLEAELCEIENRFNSHKSDSETTSQCPTTKLPGNSISIQSKKPEFRATQRWEPIKESALKNYPFFRKLVDEQHVRDYETLLKLMSLKIRVLEVIEEGTHGISKIATTIKTSEFNVQRAINTLRDFGHVSTDGQNLSEEAKRIVSFYKFMKNKSSEDAAYAALVIFPAVFMQDRGRSVLAIEHYTCLEKQIVVSGAKLLKNEQFVSEGREDDEIIYFGNMPKTMRLYKSMLESYRRVE